MGQIVSDVTDILDYKDAKKEARSARREILEQMARDEQDKVNLVNKTLAAQRAKYGAAGMSGNGATARAVLRRLGTETAQPYEEKKRTNTEKLKKIKVAKPNVLKSLLGRFDELLG